MATPERAPVILKSGAVAHVLTTEERRKGALTLNERRRLQGLSLRARVADQLEKRAHEIVEAVLENARTTGDGRDFLALWRQTHGTPAVEVTGADGGPIEIEVSAARDRLAGRIAGIAERSGEAGSA